MREAGFDLAAAHPQRLTGDLASRASLLVTMGCGEACPVVPGAQREDWLLPDPKGQSLEQVRASATTSATAFSGWSKCRGWR
jgi:arsenate reductase